MREKVQKKSSWEMGFVHSVSLLLFALCVTLSLLGRQLPKKGAQEKVSVRQSETFGQRDILSWLVIYN